MFPLKTKKNANPSTTVFAEDGSNKTHPTNVLGRASTTLHEMALAAVRP